jgi:MFS family permease
MTSTSPSAAPTRVRYSVLFLLCLLAMITYLDRAMYGSAKDDMMDAVGQPREDFFLVLVVFQLAYALFEIPTGWMGDTYGPRKTLLRIVLWWSLFVSLTAFAGVAIPGSGVIVIGFGVLVGMQFLFGMGEAGAFPNITRAIYNWFPEDRRGSAKGAIWMSARLMGGLTPALWVLLVVIAGLSWRQALWLFSTVAVVWCILFYRRFRNVPAEHPGVNDAERRLIEAGKVTASRASRVPWGVIVRSRNVWALCIMYTVTNFNWYFLMYYLPGTLKAQFPEWKGTDGGLLLLGILAGAPLLVGMGGCLLGGYLTDHYIRRTGDRKWGRRIFGMLGYGLAGLCYALSTLFTGGGSHDPTRLWLFAGCLMLVGFCNDLIMGPAWATAQDIGRRYTAIVAGTMNMVGNLGAALGNYVTGRILKAHTVGDTVQTDGYVICFLMFAVVYALGVVAWLFIDPTKPVDPDDQAERLDKV